MGRTRAYATNADRQAAYRVRKAEEAEERRAKGLNFIEHAERVAANWETIKRAPDPEAVKEEWRRDYPEEWAEIEAWLRLTKTEDEPKVKTTLSYEDAMRRVTRVLP